MATGYRLIFPSSFYKRERRFLSRHPELAARYFKVLLLLERDPQHPSLRLHALQGRLRGLHSVSISIKYRITLRLEVRHNEILLVDIGGHEIYRP